MIFAQGHPKLKRQWPLLEDNSRKYDEWDIEFHLSGLHSCFSSSFRAIISPKFLYLSSSKIRLNCTARSRMTFDTFCLIDIFWSPNFYTIILTKLFNCCSLAAIHSIQLSRILRVRLTIFGLESFNILRRIGKTAFIDDSNYGLCLLTWILNKRSSIASVLSLREPSPVTKENSLPPIISLFSTFFSSILIDLLIFSNLLWLELFLIISRFYSFS